MRNEYSGIPGTTVFGGGKIAHRAYLLDQATVLSQLPVLDHPLAVGGMRSAAELLSLR
jgi:hypothetical protein